MLQNVILISATVLMAFGVFMATIPMLPALSYMFIIALIFALYGNFLAVTGANIIILLGIVLLSIIIDHTSGILGAKYGGAHTKSLLWGIAGAILGTFIFPVLGSFIGLFLAVLGAELYYKKPQDKALKAAGGALAGTVVGVIVNITLSIVFIGLFIYFALV